MPGLQTCPACGRLYVGAACPNCRAAAAKEKKPAGTAGSAIPGYEVLETLGKGGMGVVYKARQTATGRLVALKIPPGDREAMRNFAGRFQREAAALRALCHPHIVAFVDCGQNDDAFFVAMEFVEGVSLRQILRGRRLRIDETVRLLTQVCDGLEFAHARGVIHRDIKPDNILLDSSGQAKIADFGLAKIVGPAAEPASSGLSLTATGSSMGTSAYAAPEQLVNAKAVDHRVDIYSAGVMLFELLTGDLPVGRNLSPGAKENVPAHLDAATARAIDPDPARRFQSAAEFRSALSGGGA